MVLYIILLIVSFGFAVRAVGSMLRAPFIDPTDLAMLSIVYYAVPLSAAGYFSFNYRGMVFLHPYASSSDLAFTSLSYVVLSLFTLEIGRIAGKALGPPIFNYSFKIGQALIARTALTYPILLVLAGFGVLSSGVSDFFSGYASEVVGSEATIGYALIYSSAELLGMTIMMSLLIGRITGRTPLKGMIILSLLWLALLLIIRAKRLEIIVALIPPLLIVISNSRVNSLSLRLVGIASLTTMLLVISTIRINSGADTPSPIWYLLSEGLYAGHSLSGIIARIETYGVSYEYGARFVNGLLAFVPSFIWSGKDEMVYAGNEILKGVSPLGATTFLAEVVLQGGIVPVILTYTLMGFAFERIKQFQLVWDRGLEAGVLPLRFGVYLVCIAVFIPHFRDGIIPSLKLTIQAFAFFVILSGLKFSRGPRRVHGTIV